MASTVDLSTVQYYVSAILADGSTVTLETVAENIAWEENRNELAVRLNLTLRDIPHQGKRLSQALALCTAIYLYADWGAGKKEVFRGTVWEWEHSQIADDQIVLTCYDQLYYLQKSSDNRYYPQGTGTSTIIQDIMNSWGVPLGRYAGPNINHEKILYKNKTIAAMLTETLEDAVEHGGSEAVIRASEGKAEIVSVGSNEEIYGFSADTNLIQSKDRYSMANLITRVVIVGKEDDEGRTKVETTVDGRTEYGILQAIQSIGSGTVDDAKKAADKTLKDKGQPTRTVTLQSPDFPLIRKGDRIHVKTDLLDGFFIVRGVSHNATAMTMQMEVEPSE